MIYQTKILIMLLLYISVFIIAYHLGRKLGKKRNKEYFYKWYRVGVLEEQKRVEKEKTI